MSDRRGLALIVAAAALWGTTGTAQALGPEGSDPIAVGVMRLVIAGPALVATAAWAGRLSRPDGWAPILGAAVGMAAYQPLFFTAVRSTGVALGTVVAIGSAPILAGVIAWVADSERPLPRWWGATALGVGGVASIVLAGGESGGEPAGIAAAAGAGLAFAVYIVASRRVVSRSDPVGGMSLVFVTAAVLSSPLLAVSSLDWLGEPTGVLMALHLGLIATALAYVFFATGLRTTPTAPAATASLAEPLTATLLGVLALGEMPGPSGWAGMALVLCALLLLSSRRGTGRSLGKAAAGKGWS